MQSNSLGKWLGACLLAAPLILGCTHARTSHSRAPRTPVAEASPAAHPEIVQASHVTQASHQTVQSPPTSQFVPATTVRLPIAPVVEVAVSSQPASQAVEQEPAVAPTEHKSPEPPASNPRQSPFARAEDYSWLAGQAEYSRLGKGWRLRYLSCEQEDCHGGSVTLTGHASLSGLKDGDLIRVCGHLTNPGDRSIAPSYRVDSIEMIQPGR